MECKLQNNYKLSIVNTQLFELISTYCDHHKHALWNIEGVPPVVVRHRPVVLPHSEKPAAQNLREHGHSGVRWNAHFVLRHTLLMPHLIVNFKLLNSTKIQKHPQWRGDHGVVVQGEVVEVELVDAQLNAKGDLRCLQGGRGCITPAVVTKFSPRTSCLFFHIILVGVTLSLSTSTLEQVAW